MAASCRFMEMNQREVEEAIGNFPNQENGWSREMFMVAPGSLDSPTSLLKEGQKWFTLLQERGAIWIGEVKQRDNEIGNEREAVEV